MSTNYNQAIYTSTDYLCFMLKNKTVFFPTIFYYFLLSNTRTHLQFKMSVPKTFLSIEQHCNFESFLKDEKIIFLVQQIRNKFTAF